MASYHRSNTFGTCAISVWFRFVCNPNTQNDHFDTLLFTQRPFSQPVRALRPNQLQSPKALALKPSNPMILGVCGAASCFTGRVSDFRRLGHFVARRPRPGGGRCLCRIRRDIRSPADPEPFLCSSTNNSASSSSSSSSRSRASSRSLDVSSRYHLSV